MNRPFVKLQDAKGKEVRIEIDPNVRFYVKEREALTPWSQTLRIVKPVDRSWQIELAQIEKARAERKQARRTRQKMKRKAQRKNR